MQLNGLYYLLLHADDVHLLAKDTDTKKSTEGLLIANRHFGLGVSTEKKLNVSVFMPREQKQDKLQCSSDICE